MKSSWFGLLIACVAAVSAAGAAAQDYPSKPIRFIVPNPPGGGTDILSRAIAAKMTETLKWQVVAENRPGAGGNIGLDAAAKSAPDGYTIAMGETSNLAVNPTLYSKLPYDPEKDLAPVILIGSVPLVLVVSADKPYGTLADLLAAAGKGSLSYASAGNGTVGHLSGELLKLAARVDMLHVPYKGAAAALTDLIGGQVDMFFASLPSAVSQIRSGKLRPIAVTTRERIAALPDVPTMIESGVRDFEATPWYGIMTPAATPSAVISRLNREIARVLQHPELQARFANDGVKVGAGTPAEFAAFIAAERRKWATAVKASGARVD